MAGAAVKGGWRQWLLLVVSTVGLGGILAMLQVILSHHNLRIDFTPEKRFTLSAHARQVLGGLERDVEIIAFVRSDDARNAEIEDLLQRVRNASPRVRCSIVDLNRNPAVARQYGIDNYAALVVESAGRRKAFTNAREELLVEAILQVTRPGRKIVYFVTGHGEQDVRNTDRRLGYSTAAAALRTEFYEVRTLGLLGEAPVPEDAAVLVIAGPRTDFLTAELRKLSAYVERGGDVLILLEPQAAPSLSALLERFGVKTGEGVVVDPENRLFAGDYMTMTVPGLSDRHPVSAALKAPPLFSQARAVALGAPAAGVRGIEVLHTAPSSWRTPELDVLRTGVAAFVGGRDQPGPISVGVSLLVDAQRADGTPATARVVVLGDADFANNFFIEYLSDKDLLVNAVNWLAGEEELVGQRPQLRKAGVNQFFVSARQGRLAFILGTVGEPAIVLLVGAVIFLRRKWWG